LESAFLIFAIYLEVLRVQIQNLRPHGEVLPFSYRLCFFGVVFIFCYKEIGQCNYFTKFQTANPNPIAPIAYSGCRITIAIFTRCQLVVRLAARPLTCAQHVS
jgi:hypothetical protein